MRIQAEGSGFRVYALRAENLDLGLEFWGISIGFWRHFGFWTDSERMLFDVEPLMCKALGRWISEGFWKGLCRILKDCGFVRNSEWILDYGFWKDLGGRLDGFW